MACHPWGATHGNVLSGWKWLVVQVLNKKADRTHSHFHFPVDMKVNTESQLM